MLVTSIDECWIGGTRWVRWSVVDGRRLIKIRQTQASINDVISSDLFDFFE
jgi:hypothetical protein